MQDSALANMFLSLLSSNKRPRVSLRISEFELLKRLLPELQHEEVIKAPNGTPTLIRMNRKRLILELKQKYKFLTPEELKVEVQEIHREEGRQCLSQ